MSRAGIPRKTVALVIKRDGGLCMLRVSEFCLGAATVADHRANRGSGGAGQTLNRPSNLVAACGVCNGAKEEAHGETLGEILARGVRLRPDSTHAKTAIRALVTPVTYPDGRTYYLLDDGTREELDVAYQEHET